MKTEHICAVLCALAVCLVFQAGDALGSSVVPLDLSGMVEAKAETQYETEYEQGWNAAHCDPLCTAGAADMEFTSGDWGSRIAGELWGVDEGAPFLDLSVSTVEPASLLVGVSETAPLGTPLLLRVDVVEEYFSHSGPFHAENLDLVIRRGAMEILAVHGTFGETTVDVFAGETLTVEYYQGLSLGEETSASLEISVNMWTAMIPEPSVVVLVGLGALGLMARRRR